MKAFLIVTLIFITTLCFSQSLRCHEEKIEACRLGTRVLLGLNLSQSKGMFPPEVNLLSMKNSLNFGTIQLESDFSELPTDKKADTLYRKMMEATGQELPILNPHLAMPDANGRGKRPFKIGTRGGGEEYSLTSDLWY